MSDVHSELRSTKNSENKFRSKIYIKKYNCDITERTFHTSHTRLFFPHNCDYLAIEF